MNFHIIYLGKRGGGVELTLYFIEQTMLDPKTDLKSVVISPRNEKFEIHKNFSTKIIKFGRNGPVGNMLLTLKILLKGKRTFKEMGITPGSVVLFPMVSPMDLVLNYILHRNGITVVRVIHEAHKHPGDIWPGKWTNRFILKRADRIIVLSRNVRDDLSKVYLDKIRLIPHPFFELQDKVKIENPSVPEFYILFVGRIRKYKGINLLLSMWEKSKQPDNLQLVIAGEGRIKAPKTGKIQIINRWLSSSEISYLIDCAEVVVFPYLEASQSGLIPIAMMKNKKIVATPINGLIEQLDGYPNAFIADAVDELHLNLAIQKAISSNSLIAKKEWEQINWTTLLDV